MQICNIVFRRRAALYKVKIGALVNYNQSVLKLACTGRIEPEIRLKRNFNRNSGRNIDKRAAAPHSAVKRRKLMIVRGDELHKMLAHHIGIRAFKRAFHIRVNNAQLGNLAAHIVVNKLRIILRADLPQAICALPAEYRGAQKCP